MPTLSILKTKGLNPVLADRVNRMLKHPKCILFPDAGSPITLPYAPRETSHGGWADRWSEHDRPGRKPLLLRDGDSLKTLEFTAVLAHRDNQASIESLIDLLHRLAIRGARITILGMSKRERGPWRLTNIDVDVTLRQAGTNKITQATATLSFTEVIDPDPRLGPITKGKKKRKQGLKKARKYTIKKGDTLRKLAARFYGEPDEWKRIAKRNKMKKSGPLKPGKVITIPPDDKD